MDKQEIEQEILKLAFERRLVSISTVIKRDGEIAYTAVSAQGDVWEGWTRKVGDETQLHWHPVSMVFHWYQLGATPE